MTTGQKAAPNTTPSAFSSASNAQSVLVHGFHERRPCSAVAGSEPLTWWMTNREVLAIEIDLSLPAPRIIRVPFNQAMDRLL